MELIKITEQNGQRVVSARELHSFLESKKQFADWITHRIKKYGLIESVDYQTLSLNGEKGRPSIEYALTLDAAKELSMVEGNAKGKQARKYFIECERIARQPVQVKLPTIKELAQAVIKLEDEKEMLLLINEKQSKELNAAAPLVTYANTVLISESTYNTNLIAKELGMSAISLNQILRAKGVQYKQADTWVLYHKYQAMGLTKTKTSTYTGTNGEVKTSMLTVWTEAGRKFIHELMKNNLAVA